MQEFYDSGARKLMQCCACHVICCASCDPNPDGISAGMAAREAWSGPFMDLRLAEYTDCTFCCSRPDICSGLADFLTLAQQLEGSESSGDDDPADSDGDDEPSGFVVTVDVDDDSSDDDAVAMK